MHVTGSMYMYAAPGVMEVNKEFEPKISEFAEDSNWVHHVPYILPQVRQTHRQTDTHTPLIYLTGSYDVVEPCSEGRR